MDFQVIWSDRVTTAIQVTKDGDVIVKAPRSMSKKDIKKLLWENEAWIEKKKQEVAQERELYPPKRWQQGELFYLVGNPYPLVIKETPFSDAAYIVFKDEQIQISTPYKDPDFIREVMLDFYMKNAQQILPGRVEAYNEYLKLPVNKIVVKEQKTRWGSCTARGNINLNWKLVMADVKIIDYVVVHELCHFYEMNHSDAFWRNVGRILPDYKERRQWLKDNTAFFNLE